MEQSSHAILDVKGIDHILSQNVRQNEFKQVTKRFNNKLFFNEQTPITAKNNRKSRIGKGRGLAKKGNFLLINSGGAGGKGTWGKIGENMEVANRYIDKNDPNYDSESSEDVIAEVFVPELKSEELETRVKPIILEYFDHGNAEEVLDSLFELNVPPSLRPKIARLAISLALDRKDGDKELTSILLSEMGPHIDLHGGVCSPNDNTNENCGLEHDRTNLLQSGMNIHSSTTSTIDTNKSWDHVSKESRPTNIMDKQPILLQQYDSAISSDYDNTSSINTVNDNTNDSAQSKQRGVSLSHNHISTSSSILSNSHHEHKSSFSNNIGRMRSFSTTTTSSSIGGTGIVSTALNGQNVVSPLYEFVMDKSDFYITFLSILRDDLNEWTVDIPGAPQIVGNFLARVIGDDCLEVEALDQLEMYFYQSPVTFHPDTLDHIRKAIDRAKYLLKYPFTSQYYLRHHGESITLGEPVSNMDAMLIARDKVHDNLAAIWGATGSALPIKTLIKLMDRNLRRFLSEQHDTLIDDIMCPAKIDDNMDTLDMSIRTKDWIKDGMERAGRALKELNVPHFHHEYVYRALVLVLKDGTYKTALLIRNLLAYLVDVEGVLDCNSIDTGFERLIEDLPKICKVIPKAKELFEQFVDLCSHENGDSINTNQFNIGNENSVNETLNETLTIMHNNIVPESSAMYGNTTRTRVYSTASATKAPSHDWMMSSNHNKRLHVSPSVDNANCAAGMMHDGFYNYCDIPSRLPNNLYQDSQQSAFVTTIMRDIMSKMRKPTLNFAQGARKRYMSESDGSFQLNNNEFYTENK